MRSKETGAESIGSVENYLKEINAVLGVSGSFVCLPDTQLAAAAMPDQIDQASVENAARIVTQTINALETLGQRVAEADLVYAQGRLVVKNLNHYVLVIACARNINLPLLNLTANVVAKKLAAESKTPKPESIPRAPLAETSVPTQVARAADNVGSSEIVTAQFFDELTRALARVMGPAASFFIEDELNELSEAREAFPKARVAELVERVSRAVRDETKRAQFVKTVSEIM
jgi:tRNA isopentenyl-2-thiomethyl-A-37 hydroxylase MiaE